MQRHFQGDWKFQGQREQFLNGGTVDKGIFYTKD